MAATLFGVREILFVAGIGVLAATLPLALSQVGRLSRQPDPVDDPDSRAAAPQD